MAKIVLSQPATHGRYWVGRECNSRNQYISFDDVCITVDVDMLLLMDSTDIKVAIEKHFDLTITHETPEYIVNWLTSELANHDKVGFKYLKDDDYKMRKILIADSILDSFRNNMKLIDATNRHLTHRGDPDYSKLDWDTDTAHKLIGRSFYASNISDKHIYTIDRIEEGSIYYKWPTVFTDNKMLYKESAVTVKDICSFINEKAWILEVKE